MALVSDEQQLQQDKDFIRRTALSDATVKSRAVRWPVANAPWPRTPMDGSEPTMKEDVRGGTL